MSFWQGLWLVLKNLPQLVKLVLGLRDLFLKGVKIVNVQIKLREFDEAVEQAKDGKDTKKLEAIFRP